MTNIYKSVYTDLNPDSNIIGTQETRTMVIEAWGEQFETVRVLAMDPRCQCSDTTLIYRVRIGWDPQTAATIPNQNTEPYIIWDVGFATLADVAKDPRCRVTFDTLERRMAQGQDVLWAANMPSMELAAWGDFFENLVELSEDSRCEVPYHTLVRRINAGDPPGIAASKNLPVAGR